MEISDVSEAIRGNKKEVKKESAIAPTKKIIFGATHEGSPYLIGYDRSVYYFSKDRIIKISTVPSSYWLAWALIIEVITITFFGWIIGGVIGVFPLYIVPSIILRTFVGQPREEKLAKLSFNELKNEKGAKLISWSDITKVVVKSQRLDIYFGGVFSTGLNLVTSPPQTLELLKAKLGNKLVIKTP